MMDLPENLCEGKDHVLEVPERGREASKQYLEA
jgi:hypothetical protein